MLVYIQFCLTVQRSLLCIERKNYPAKNQEIRLNYSDPVFKFVHSLLA